MRKIVIIIGPTSVGKTALALKIAEKYTGELFSADSVQVYKGLDIISGKDKDKLGKIPLKLVDIVSPHTPFSVSDYVHSFEYELKNQSDKLPIVVGGTGFYISALLHPIETSDIKPHADLRQELNKLATPELQGMLKELNPEKFFNMNNSDRNNPRRLVRAIEVSFGHPEFISGSKKMPKQISHDILIIGLFCKRESLNERIDKRVDERLEQGALAEAETLFVDYENLAPQIKQASGYKQLFEYLQGKSGLGEAITLWKTSEHQNAKKQMTWFKKQENIHWFDILENDFEAKIMEKLKHFLSSDII